MVIFEKNLFAIIRDWCNIDIQRNIYISINFLETGSIRWTLNIGIPESSERNFKKNNGKNLFKVDEISCMKINTRNLTTLKTVGISLELA